MVFFQVAIRNKQTSTFGVDTLVQRMFSADVTRCKSNISIFVVKNKCKFPTEVSKKNIFALVALVLSVKACNKFSI